MLQSTFINTRYMDCIQMLRIHNDPQSLKLITYLENTYAFLDGNLSILPLVSQGSSTYAKFFPLPDFWGK